VWLISKLKDASLKGRGLKCDVVEARNLTALDMLSSYFLTFRNMMTVPCCILVAYYCHHK